MTTPKYQSNTREFMRRRYTTPDERKLRHIIEDPALREWFENNKDNLHIEKMDAPKQLKAQLMETQEE